jgi:hypothetical protein
MVDGGVEDNLTAAAVRSCRPQSVDVIDAVAASRVHVED